MTDAPLSNPLDALDASALIGGSHHLAGAFNETLLAAKLLASSDESILPGDEMTPALLAAVAEAMLTQEAILGELAPGAAQRRQLLRSFAMLPLSDRMVVKLSLAARDRPDLFTHSLHVALCAGALAQHLRMPRHEVAEAVAAGLLHDLGFLHVDPALLQSGRRLQEHERRYLDVHPLMGYLMLADESAWHPVVSTAVLEHHERLDGNGYPRGIAGNRLGQLGQLLAVAELAATLLLPDGTALSRLRLGIVLRLNAERLNRDFAHCMLRCLPKAGMPVAGQADVGVAIDHLTTLAAAFQGWKAVLAATAAAAPLVAFVDARLARLGRNVADAGIDLEYWQQIDADIESDALSLSEIRFVAHEGVRQLIDLANEARRRWSRLQPAPAAAVAWIETVEALRR